MLLVCRNALQKDCLNAVASTHSSALLNTGGRHEPRAPVPVSSSQQAASSRHTSRPVTALLSGHRELAELISKSSSRYAEHLQAPSLEPSADVLQGVTYTALVA